MSHILAHDSLKCLSPLSLSFQGVCSHSLEPHLFRKNASGSLRPESGVGGNDKARAINSDKLDTAVDGALRLLFVLVTHHF